jgi:hypothetical protein
MGHQVNKCGCGRTIHWPRNAKHGDKWKCKGCGTIWNLVPSGTPGADSSGKVIPSWGHKAKRKTGRHHPPARTRRVGPTPKRQARPPQAKGSGGLAAGIILGLVGLAALAGLSRQ